MLGSDYLADLFPKQRAFFEDPAKVKGALAGRRGGKTWVCAAGLYDAGLRHPGSLNPYICLSAVSARRIMWPVIKAFDARYGLGLKYNDHELIAHLPNGSQIFCVGGDDVRKVEALRGGKYGRAVVDESGSFPRYLLRYLHDDVLDAALMDLDGDLWLVGSPNAACVGHFYDLTTGSNPDVAKIVTHHWNVLDNVHIPHARQWLERKRAEKRWSEDNPVYRREYLGHWVRDRDSLVFRFDRARHLIASDQIKDVIRSVIGVDLGASPTSPSMAFVVNSWCKHLRTVYTRYAKKHAGMIPATGAEELQRLLPIHSATHAVVDAGGLGTGYVEEWKIRWSLPALPAEKKQKMAYVELLNGELDGGRLLIEDTPATRPLLDEIELLQWDEDRKNYDTRFADHAADAWLYSWRDCYAWGERAAPPEGPAPGSPEALLEQAKREKGKAMREAAKRDRRRFRNGMLG